MRHPGGRFTAPDSFDSHFQESPEHTLRAPHLRKFYDRMEGVARNTLLAAHRKPALYDSFVTASFARADVTRICLFDTWVSSVLVGRSVATVAEVCFAIQWATTLRQLAQSVQSDWVQNISNTVIPLIILAECSSWYAVVATSYLGNTVENSIWAVTFVLIMTALLRLTVEFHGIARLGFAAAIVGIASYVAFLVIIDVPMFFARWQIDATSGEQLLDLGSGFHDLATRWVVTRYIADWRNEIPWMSLYFSVGVWSSLALCGLGRVKDRVQQYRVGSARRGSARQFPVAP